MLFGKDEYGKQVFNELQIPKFPARYFCKIAGCFTDIITFNPHRYVLVQIPLLNAVSTGIAFSLLSCVNPTTSMVGALYLPNETLSNYFKCKTSDYKFLIP